MGKMTVDEDEGFTQRFPEESNCRMQVTTSSGQCLEAATTYQPGHWRNPLSDEEVVDKFQRLAANDLSEPQRKTALELLWSLDKASNLRALFDSLVVS